MTMRTEVAQLAALSIVEMFQYNGAPIGDSNAFYWVSSTSLSGPVKWQNAIYEPFPIEASGFEMNSTGGLPRPKVRASNIGGALGAYLRSVKDGLGAQIIRKRTLVKYLDPENFPGGNPYADPNAHFPDEVFLISRKVSENPIFIEMELAVPFDVAGIRLPWRQVIASTCQWIYRGPDCGYSGPPVQDINGNPTSDPAQDMCRKTLSACKARFGEWGVLPTSAFPASLPTSMM